MKKNVLSNVINFIIERLEYYKRHMVNPEKYICKIYKNRMGKSLNLKKPVTYNEKLQWLKLYDHNPLYTKLVDKYTVKKYVAEKIGAQYIIPTLGVWNSFEEIDFSILPNKFVLKCTHDSGGVVICKNKEKFNKKNASKKITKSLKYNYYYAGFEWPYKDVIPRVMAEEYFEDNLTKELRDYKFFCFDGEVKFLFIATERQREGEDVKFDFYDKDFNHLAIKQGHENSKNVIEKPKCFEEMKILAEKLSKGFKEVRIDLYEVNGKVYFGEITFFHHGGWTPFEPEEWDYKFGKLIKI